MLNFEYERSKQKHSSICALRHIFIDNKQPVISFVFQESSSKGVMHEIDNNQLFCGYNFNALFIFCRVIKVVDGQFSCNITFSIVLMNNSYSILHE